MQIIPSSEVKILKNCKLKPDYQHSIWWVSAQNQYNYFAGLTKYTLNSVQYTRSTGNSIKVPYTVGQLLDCNYMIITNVGHENKHYYAFITDVEYVSETTSLVRYEIDLIQTWYFECELMPCFVEREHPVADTIGANVLPEGLDIGQYTTDGQNVMSELDECCIVVASTHKAENNQLVRDPGKMYSLIFSGLYYSKFPCTSAGIDAVKAFIDLDSFLTGGSGIVSIFMMPEAMFDDTNSGIGKTLDKYIAKNYGSFDGYTPRNNKLYTYPFNFLSVTTPQGGSRAFHYERFDSDNCGFYLSGDTTCTPGVLLTPINYNGAGVCREESLTLTGFPQCAYSTDAFAAYLSQVCSTQCVTSTAQSVAQVAMGNPLAIIPVVGTLVGAAENAFLRPGEARGNSNNSTLFSAGELNFSYGRKRITGEYAKIIDEYFDVYGYTCHRVKVPNRTSRPQWNYIKTRDCCITASLPTDIVTKIQNIYNNGITFWCWGNNVGNYSLDNRPK